MTKVLPISPVVFMLRYDKPSLYDRRTKKEKPFDSVNEAFDAKLEVEGNAGLLV